MSYSKTIVTVVSAAILIYTILRSNGIVKYDKLECNITLSAVQPYTGPVHCTYTVFGLFNVTQQSVSYTGDLVNGLRHGKGLYKTPSFTYNGDFSADYMEGYGTLEFPEQWMDYSGSMSGKFIKNSLNDEDDNNETTRQRPILEMHYIYNTSIIYRGPVKNSLMHGKGVISMELTARHKQDTAAATPMGSATSASTSNKTADGDSILPRAPEAAAASKAKEAKLVMTANEIAARLKEKAGEDEEATVSATGDKVKKTTTDVSVFSFEAEFENGLVKVVNQRGAKGGKNSKKTTATNAQPTISLRAWNASTPNDKFEFQILHFVDGWQTFGYTANVSILEPISQNIYHWDGEKLHVQKKSKQATKKQSAKTTSSKVSKSDESSDQAETLPDLNNLSPASSSSADSWILLQIQQLDHIEKIMLKSLYCIRSFELFWMSRHQLQVVQRESVSFGKILKAKAHEYDMTAIQQPPVKSEKEL